MKKEFRILFEAVGIGGVTNLHPISNKTFPTELEAEKAVEHLLLDSTIKKLYIVPVYSKL